MRIYLTGMSGVGKSSIGKRLAEALKFDFLDLDELIEKKEGKRISEIFSDSGEEYFRELERRVLLSTENRNNVIVATGGGLVISEANYKFMKSNGHIIYLMREPEVIWKEINIDNRPLLKKGGKERFIELHNKRLPIYKERCHMAFEGNWEEILRRTVAYCESINRNIYAVMGDPIEHSLSPRIHNFLISYYNIKDKYYLPVKLPKDKPELFTELWEALSLGGANVTMPHKQNVMEYLSYTNEDAKLYNSVNTVKKTKSGLVGYNTDALGFLASLEELGFSVYNADVVILGSGGVTSTLAICLLKAGAKNITVASRNKKTLAEAQETVKVATNKTISFSDFSDDALSKVCKKADLLVNATPLGMNGVSNNFENLEFLSYLPKKSLVYDLIYNPPKTKLLLEAEKEGLQTLNGLSMLIWQAFYAFEIFFGLMPGKKEKEMVMEYLFENKFV